MQNEKRDKTNPHSTESVLTACNEFADYYSDQPAQVEKFLFDIFSNYLSQEHAKRDRNTEAIEFCVKVTHLVRSSLIPGLYLTERKKNDELFEFNVLATQMLQKMAPSAYDAIQSFIILEHEAKQYEILEKIVFECLGSRNFDEQDQRQEIMSCYFGFRELTRFLYSFFEAPMRQIARRTPFSI